MAHFSLIEKPRRRMKQPTKDYIRAELKLAEAELERVHGENEQLRAELTTQVIDLTMELKWQRIPWWCRWMFSKDGHKPPYRFPSQPPSSP
jgi:hypothetical protein